MLIYLLRHGDASQITFSDRQRPLSEERKISISLIAQYIASNRIGLTKIITSPLLRVWQRTQIVADNLHLDKKIEESDYLMSESDPVDIIHELSNFDNDEKILLVSHQPFLGFLISHLICKEFAKIEVRKASLACVEIEQPVSVGKGVLRFLINLENMN
jgi:phosphohistidine phosphatase